MVKPCQDVIWAELARGGILRDDWSTWATPVVRSSCPEGGPFVQAGTQPAVQEACDQLIGRRRRWCRPGVGGTIPVRFRVAVIPAMPAGISTPAMRWTGGGRSMCPPAPKGSSPSTCSRMWTRKPTRLRPISHRDIPPLLAPAGTDGADWNEAARWAAHASAHRRAVLATGRAGDAFLCHPFLVHASSWPHLGGSLGWWPSLMSHCSASTRCARLPACRRHRWNRRSSMGWPPVGGSDCRLLVKARWLTRLRRSATSARHRNCQRHPDTPGNSGTERRPTVAPLPSGGRRPGRDPRAQPLASSRAASCPAGRYARSREASPRPVPAPASPGRGST